MYAKVYPISEEDQTPFNGDAIGIRQPSLQLLAIGTIHIRVLNNITIRVRPVDGLSLVVNSDSIGFSDLCVVKDLSVRTIH